MLCDDVIKWKHFPAYLALCAGNSPVPVNSPRKGQWRRTSMFSLICIWINDWINNREAGDLRRHRGHYDVNVIYVNIFNFSFGLQITYKISTTPMQQCRLSQRWPSVGTVVLTLGQRWLNLYCCMGDYCDNTLRADMGKFSLASFARTIK